MHSADGFRSPLDLLGQAAAPIGAGLGGHQSARIKNDEWLTPPWLVQSLGVFDLDPCAPIKRPWETALKHYTREDDGLAKAWLGRVWLNPPYGTETGKWMERMAEHGNGIALIFARTDTDAWMESVWPHAAAVLFIHRRLTFHTVDGQPGEHNGGAPSALIAYGHANAAVLLSCGIKGAYLPMGGAAGRVVGA